MNDKKDEKLKPEEEIAENPLQGTFFDTFEFNPKEEAAEKKEEEKKPPKEEKPDTDKKVEEEIKETSEEDEELQEQIEVAYKAIKEKDEKDLDDEDKKFLEDYEAGNLKEVKEEKETGNKEEGFDTLTKSLIEDGVLVALEDDELEDNEDSFKKAINKTVETKIEEWVNEIPEEYRNVIEHMQNGGDVNSYLQSRQQIDYDNLDFTNESVQEALVRANLAQQGYEKDDIDEKLQDLKDLEKIEKEAKVAAKLFSKQQTERIEVENKKIEEESRKQQEEAEKEIEEISSTIDSMDDIAGFKLTDKRREAFKSYLFDVDENGETAASKASQSVDSRIKLYFMDFINYDFKDLQKSVETKKTRDLTKILSRYKDTQTASTGKSVENKLKEDDEQFELKLPSIFGG